MQRFQSSSGQQLFSAVVSKSFDDVCTSEFPTLYEAAEGSDKDKMRTLQFICAAIVDYLNFKNRKNTMTTQQVAETATLILEEYPYLRLDDLKLFVRRLKLNAYGEVFDLDGQVFLGWLNKYVEEKRTAQYRLIKQREEEESERKRKEDEEVAKSPEAKAAAERFFRNMEKLFKHTDVNSKKDWSELTDDEKREKIRMKIIRQQGARLLKEFPETYVQETEKLVEAELERMNKPQDGE